MRKSILLGAIAGALTVYLIIAVSILFEGESTQVSTRTLPQLGIGGDAPTPAVSREGDAISALSKDGNFTVFLEALSQSGLMERLSGPEEFTIFAPSDEAFTKVRSDVMYSILTNQDILRAMLANHIVQGNISASELDQANSVKSIEGGNLDVTKDSVNSVHISKDISATNGTVHVIDEILLPPEYLLMPSEQI